MNLLPSQCRKCGIQIMVNQAMWDTLSSHDCMQCAEDTSPESVAGAKKTLMSEDTINKDADTTIEELEEELRKEAERKGINLDDWELFDEELIIDDLPKCECGAESAGTKFHSHWCPIFKEYK